MKRSQRLHASRHPDYQDYVLGEIEDDEDDEDDEGAWQLSCEAVSRLKASGIDIECCAWVLEGDAHGVELSAYGGDYWLTGTWDLENASKNK